MHCTSPYSTVPLLDQSEYRSFHHFSPVESSPEYFPIGPISADFSLLFPSVLNLLNFLGKKREYNTRSGLLDFDLVFDLGAEMQVFSIGGGTISEGVTCSVEWTIWG